MRQAWHSLVTYPGARWSQDLNKLWRAGGGGDRTGGGGGGAEAEVRGTIKPDGATYPVGTNPGGGMRGEV